jgi:hypothetical protein
MMALRRNGSRDSYRGSTGKVCLSSLIGQAAGSQQQTLTHDARDYADLRVRAVFAG